MNPLEIIKEEWPVITGAPRLALGLLLIGAVISWWWKGHLAKAEIAGLKAEAGGLRAKNDVEVSRTDFFRDRLDAQKEELDRARLNVLKLGDQQKHAATLDEIAVTTASILKNVERASTANTELTRTISLVDSLHARDSYSMKLEPAPSGPPWRSPSK
jgi:hypothetical protein